MDWGFVLVILIIFIYRAYNDWLDYKLALKKGKK